MNEQDEVFDLQPNSRSGRLTLVCEKRLRKLLALEALAKKLGECLREGKDIYDTAWQIEASLK